MSNNVLRLTVNDIMGLKPCARWSREEIEEYFGDRESILVTETLQDQNVSVDGRIWLGIAALSERSQRIFACDCAELELLYDGEPDDRPWAAVEVARRYADGFATRGELDNANLGAWTALISAAPISLPCSIRTAWATTWPSARAAAYVAVYSWTNAGDNDSWCAVDCLIELLNDEERKK